MTHVPGTKTSRFVSARPTGVKHIPSLLATAVWLIGLYVACQMIADIAAGKLVQLFGIIIPGGTFIYAATFTLRDLIHRRLGEKVAKHTIIAAGVVNILMALYFKFVLAMPFPVFWGGQEAFTATLGWVWTIVGSSIVAEVISELVDTNLYTFAYERNWHPWLRVIFSNLFSVPLDSVLFAGLAFSLLPNMMGGTPADAAHLWEIIWGQTLFKWAVGAIIMPTISLVRD